MANMKGYRPPTSYQNGRYVPIRVLGTGTYGQVLLCEDTHVKVSGPNASSAAAAPSTGKASNASCPRGPQLPQPPTASVVNKQVAVKVAQRDAAYRRSALNEIKALETLKKANERNQLQVLSSIEHFYATAAERDQLAHFCSVEILNYFEEDGHICIVTELLQRNIFEVLKERKYTPFSTEKIKCIGYNVLSALAALHESGLMHCDIKPENIMLRENSTAIVPRAVNGVFSHSHSHTHAADASVSGVRGGHVDVHTSSSSGGNSTPMTMDNGITATSNMTGSTASYIAGGDCSSSTAVGCVPQSMGGVHSVLPQQQQRKHASASCAVVLALQHTGGPHSEELDVTCNSTPTGSDGVGDDEAATAASSSDIDDDDVSVDSWSGSSPVSADSEESEFSRFSYEYVLTDTAASSTLPLRGPTSAASSVSTGAAAALQRRRLYDFSKTVLIDFGAVRELHENAYYDVQSLWYRSPEVLCGLPYTPSIDAFSCGCLLFEVYTGKPLFAGNDVKSQLFKIVSLLGLPSESALHRGELVSQYNFLFSTSTPVTAAGHPCGPPTTSIVRTVPQEVIEANFATYARECRRAGLDRLARYRESRQFELDHLQWKQAQQSGVPLPRLGAPPPACGASHISSRIAVASAVGFNAKGSTLAVTQRRRRQRREQQAAKDEEELIKLIFGLLQPDETRRLSCLEALHHPFFASLTQAKVHHRRQQQQQMLLPLTASGRLRGPHAAIAAATAAAQQQQQQDPHDQLNNTLTINSTTPINGSKFGASMTMPYSDCSPFSDYGSSSITQASFTNSGALSRSSLNFSVQQQQQQQQQSSFYVASIPQPPQASTLAIKAEGNGDFSPVTNALAALNYAAYAPPPIAVNPGGPAHPHHYQQQQQGFYKALMTFPPAAHVFGHGGHGGSPVEPQPRAPISPCYVPTAGHQQHHRQHQVLYVSSSNATLTTSISSPTGTSPLTSNTTAGLAQGGGATLNVSGVCSFAPSENGSSSMAMGDGSAAGAVQGYPYPHSGYSISAQQQQQQMQAAPPTYSQHMHAQHNRQQQQRQHIAAMAGDNGYTHGTPTVVSMP